MLHSQHGDIRATATMVCQGLTAPASEMPPCIDRDLQIEYVPKLQLSDPAMGGTLKHDRQILQKSSEMVMS